MTPNESSGLLQNKDTADIPGVPHKVAALGRPAKCSGQLSHLPSFIKKLRLQAALKQCKDLLLGLRPAEPTFRVHNRIWSLPHGSACLHGETVPKTP